MSDNQELSQASENTTLAVDHPSHLKPWLWKPGQSGNPHGRPKKLTSILEQVLFEEKDKNGITKAQKLVKAAVERAIKKSDFLVKEVWDRTEGKLKEDRDEQGGIQVVVITRND